MDKHLEVLNHLLVETFNEILKVEEQSLRLASDNSVTVTEVHTLDAIGLGEPRTITELAAAMMVTVSTMTISINRLEKKGLVERERANDDRRIVRVRLTDKGHALTSVHQRFHRRMAKSVIEHLAPGEVEALSHAMENLKGFFQRESEMNSQGKKQAEDSEKASSLIF